MLEGIIVKGIAGFYYVKVDDKVYECRARGLFRKKKLTPLVGDKVEISISEIDNTGYVLDIKKRDTELFRPPVANVDQAVIVFAAKNPEPNLWLLDRFILLAEHNNLKVNIVINKIDIVNENELYKISNIYKNIGYKVIETSNFNSQGIDELKVILKDKITVFAGPSGVGKSTLLNTIQPNLKLKTGEISQKTKRGKHTTRHAELIELDLGGWVVDTAGFSSLDINFIKENFSCYFIEFEKYSLNCRFNSCKHINEPDCAVKEAVDNGNISEERYKNYVKFIEEIKEGKRRY